MLEWIWMKGRGEGMVFYIIITAVLLLFGSWNLMIAILGLFPKFLETTMGTLTKTKNERNVVQHSRYNHTFIPLITYYTYTYKVRGRAYRYSNESRHSERRLLPKAPLVYVKWFPRHAYLHKFKGEKEWMWGVFSILLGVIFLILILLTE